MQTKSDTSAITFICLEALEHTPAAMPTLSSSSSAAGRVHSGPLGRDARGKGFSGNMFADQLSDGTDVLPHKSPLDRRSLSSESLHPARKCLLLPHGLAINCVFYATLASNCPNDLTVAFSSSSPPA